MKLPFWRISYIAVVLFLILQPSSDIILFIFYDLYTYTR